MSKLEKAGGKSSSMKRSWSLLPLGEIATITMGNSPPGESYNDTGDGMSLVNGPVEFSAGAFGKTKRTKFTTSPTKVCKQDDFLICVRGSTTGRTNIASEDACIGRGVASIRAKANQRYINHFVRTLEKNIHSSGRGSTFPSISQEQLQQLMVPVPDFGDDAANEAEQKRIADILDKADAIRRKRQVLAEEAEQVLPSTFFSLFGDPVFNPKDFASCPINDVADGKDGIKCGPFGTQLAKSEYVTEGVPLWGIPHVNRKFKRKTHEFVTKEKASQLNTYSLLAGDIVMTRKGTVGNCAVYPSDLPNGIMHSDLLRLRLDSSKAIPEFMSAQLMLSRAVEHQISLVSSGAIMAGINVTRLKTLEILVPPIELQRQYRDRVIAFRDAARKLETVAKEYSTLFDSLVQLAFKGEL